MYRYINHFIIIFLTISINLIANDVLHQADSLYFNHNYSEALDRYEVLLKNDRFLKNDFNLNFKLAFCYLKSNQLQKAEHIFSDLNLKSDLIPEYIDYFLSLIALYKDDLSLVTTRTNRYFEKYPTHFLNDSLRSHLADFVYRNGEYRQAWMHYKKLMRNIKYKAQRPLFMYRMAMCDLYINKRQEAMDRFFQILIKYPSSEEALRIVEMLRAYKIDDTKYMFPIADVYLNHKVYHPLRQELEYFIHTSEDKELIEKARYYLIRLYYEEGQYQAALYGFNTLMSNLKNKRLEPRLLLMIARCELRSGQKSEAARSYLQYAKNYPRRRIAAETVWKAAWIYEELGDIKQALTVYNKLEKHWPRSQYRREAAFRIGFSYYRLGQYYQAAEKFRSVARRNWNTFSRHRAFYWLAKTYRQRGLNEEAKTIYYELGSQLLKSYYSLKAYYENQAYLDSILNTQEKLTRNDNPLKAYTASMASHTAKFEKIFVVHELLSDAYSFSEIYDERYRATSVGEWIALAETYKRLEAYNRAFQIYDYLDNKHFHEMDNLEKPFLLKEAYPLYFDRQILHYAEERRLDRHLVLAVIRAESAYNKRAHSWADAYGLMQIIPRTASQLAGELSLAYSDPTNLFDVDLNINMGTYYLRKLLQRFDGQNEYALAAYNAGPHRVEKWLKMNTDDDIDVFVENIEFSQTRNYVRKVLRNYWIYTFLESLH
jgi:soluble lytic murein transglycosylase-like protein